MLLMKKLRSALPDLVRGTSSDATAVEARHLCSPQGIFDTLDLCRSGNVADNANASRGRGQIYF
jgi:hypothetical protein